MKYTDLSVPDREQLLAKLQAMPAYLQRTFEGLSAAAATVAGPEGTFSPVEHCWHLADLEREGFADRIQRLLIEDGPLLPDFDGARVARERHYRGRSLAEGLLAFAQARRANVAVLRSLAGDQWKRGGRQEGVGPVMLCDIPVMMAQHDSSHVAEIDEWLRCEGRRTTGT